MARNINQSARLLAGMLAALSTGLPYHLPSIQIEREPNPILDGLNAKSDERQGLVESERFEKARLKRERKNLRKGVDKN